MNTQAQTPPSANALCPARQTGHPIRVACIALVAVALVFALSNSANAQFHDSFFDVFVDISVNGQVNMSPVNSGAFPFPPPPLDFPDLPTGDTTVEIKMVSLSLQSVAPMVVGPTQPDGSFQVDSFFDIHYELNVTGDTGIPEPIIDSFFDVSYSMHVEPLAPVILPDGSELREFQTEIIAMNLTGANPVDMSHPDDPDFNFGLDLLPAAEPGHRHHGHVTILKLAGTSGGGGNFNVDSFFDIFVEVSVDGGPPTASTQALQEDGRVRLQSSNPGVPEPTSLALLGLGGLALLRRRA